MLLDPLRVCSLKSFSDLGSSVWNANTTFVVPSCYKKTTIINSDWWSAGKDIPSTKKSTAEPPLYGYLVITDSLLCPWGKKPLTFFLNTDTPLIGTLFYDLLSIRINQVLLLFSIEHRSSLSCYNHRYLSVPKIACVNFSVKSQHSFLPSFLEASQDVILFPVLRWQTPCICKAVLRRKYKVKFYEIIIVFPWFCYSRHARHASKHASNPRPNPNKDLHTYDPYVMFPHNVISAILVSQSNETTNTEQTSPIEKAPFSYVKPFFF